jgi:hypothetical protein
MMDRKDDVRIVDPTRCTREDSVTPHIAMAASVASVAAAWNREMPVEVPRVKVINMVRRRDMECLLMDYTDWTIGQVICWYARRPWNVRQRAWMRFDAFIDGCRFAQLHEEMCQAPIRAGAGESVKAAAKAAMTASASPVADRAKDLILRWGQLPDEATRRYLHRATARLLARGVKSATAAAVEAEAMMILREEGLAT